MAGEEQVGSIVEAQPTAQILGQKRRKLVSHGLAIRTYTQPFFPSLFSWAWLAPLSAHRISSLHPPSSPPASHSPFHQLPHSHICFSLLVSSAPPSPFYTLPSLSNPGFSCPFISPFLALFPLKLPVQEAGDFKRRSKLGSPIKDQALPRANPLPLDFNSS